jgi:hypothetical protein
MEEETRKQLAKVLRGQRNRYIAAIEAMEGSQPSAYGAQDFAQMIDGFLALLEEALTSTSSDVRTLYLETAIPSLLKTGTNPFALLTGTVGFAVVLSVNAVAGMPEGQREQAQRWLSAFFSDWMGELLRAAGVASPEEASPT